jgi:hypothetical protein
MQQHKAEANMYVAAMQYRNKAVTLNGVTHPVSSDVKDFEVRKFN